MPTSYTPTPKAVGRIRVPVDGDPRNAAAFAGPLQQAADLAVYARGVYARNYRLALAKNGAHPYAVAGGLGADLGGGARARMFVATGPNGTFRSYSSDTWQEIGGISSLAVAYSESLHMWAACGVNAQSSPDGVTWAQRTTPSSTWLRAMTVAADGSFVAVGDAVAGQTYIVRSEDGIAWEQQVSPLEEPMRGVALGTDGRLVAVGGISEARAIFSDDHGETWEEAAMPTNEGNAGEDIAFDGRYFVARGADGTVMRSMTGIDWEEALGELLPMAAGGRGCIAADPACGVVVASGGPQGKVVVSYDHGDTFEDAYWLSHSPTALSHVCGLSFAHGRFFIGSTAGVIAAGLAR